MRIFVLACVYPNEHNPIAGIYVKEHCELLTTLGHDVTVLDASAYSPGQWLRSSRKPCRIVDGYALHRLGIMDSRLPRYAAASYMYCAQALYGRAVREHGKPDLLVAHYSFQAGFAARKIAQRENIPFLVIEHYSLYLKQTIPGYIRRQLQKTVRDAAAFVCVSKSLQKNIERHTGIENKIIVIPNPISPIFSYTPAAGAPPFVFFCAGGTKAGKRTDLLIHAFMRAFPPGLRVKLVIAGPGDGWSGLQAAASADERISFIGRIGRDEMRRQFAACHCYVMPSAHETFGIVYREAMAVGRPVISAKNGGIEENWEDTFGILVEKDDVAALAVALQNMNLHYGRYDGEAISLKCLNRYGVWAIAEQYEKVLMSLEK